MKTRDSKTKEIAISSTSEEKFSSDLDDGSEEVDEFISKNATDSISSKSRKSFTRLRRTSKPILTALQPLSPATTNPDSPLEESESDLLWAGIDNVFEAPILESRLRDTRRPTKLNRIGRHDTSTNNNSHNHVNNNLIKDEPVFRKLADECRKRPTEEEVFFFRVENSDDVPDSTSDIMKVSHRRDKKAKVKLKETSIDDINKDHEISNIVEMKNLQEQTIEDDKKRKKEDKSRKKKVRQLEEENHSKRLYDSRDLLVRESRPNFADVITTTQNLPQFVEDGYTNEIILMNSRIEEERKGGVLRLKSCSECGSRHAGSVCPFSRPTQRLPDKCQLPDVSGHLHQNGVIVAPHREKPVNLSNGTSDESSIDETWRSPQRPGSPGCYSRISLPLGLGLEMRPILPPQDTNQEENDDTGMMGIQTSPTKDIEVVVAKACIGRYTQLGPVIGVPAKEKDIPDDFCMVNLWEVFGGEGKRYLSTVDPNKSNWTRYLRPAPDRETANLIVVPRQLHDSGETDIIPGIPVESIAGIAVFLVTTQDINSGDELMFWAHDPTLAWSRKKMEKTNCGGCNMRFSHPLYYRMHCSVFHDPNYSLTIRKYHCKVCGLAVLGKENIMRHAAEQHDGRGAYQCQFCKKFFLRLNYLDMHRTYGCAANPQRTRPLCDFCGRKFCQPQKLKVHIKRMHSDMAEVLREFQCKLCFKILGSRAALQRHLKEVHHKDLSSGATCDRCGKMFQNKSNLKIHMLTHSGVKPFRCIESSCNAAFTTKQCLQFHYKKVHGYSGEAMPTIERCIPYTFDSYSGGLVTDPDTGKVTRIPSVAPSEETSTDSNLQAETVLRVVKDNDGDSIVGRSPSPIEPQEVMLSTTKLPPADSLHTFVKYATASRLVSKGSRKWLGDTLESFDKAQDEIDQGPESPKTLYTFEDRLDLDNQSKADIIEREDKSFRRESNASLLVEAALNVAEGSGSLKSETRLIGTHDRLLSYSGAVNGGTSSTRYSPSLTITNAEDHLLPHEAALTTHIKYSEGTDDDRGNHLEYTLEREYDPRDLPEVVVVHESVSSRDLNDSLDFQEHLHSALENLPTTSEDNLQEIHNVHDLALSKSDLPPAAPPTPSESNTSISSSGVLEPTLHVLDHLPVTQGLPVSMPTSLAVGLDMTYKHYRIVPETSISSSITPDHLLSAAPLDDTECTIGLDTMTESEMDAHPMSPRNDHIEHIPLPELQPHDFRGLQNLRSPSRSPYLSPSHTPEESLRSYLISTDGLRSPPPNDQGIDMSRSNIFIRTSELPTIAYRYQNDVPGSPRAQVYEIERPPSHSVDLSLIGRSVAYTDISRSVASGIYVTEARAGSNTPTLYITSQRDDVRQSLDLTVPRSESASQSDSPIERASSPNNSPQHTLSPSQLSPSNPLISYSQISHSSLSPMQTSNIDRSDASSSSVTGRSLESESPGPSTSASTPLPPISRIVSASPHSFYSTRQVIPASRQDITLSLPTHVYTESYVVSNGTALLLDQQPPTPGPTPPTSTVDKERSSSPYLQYPSSPYGRYSQEISSPPSGFQYQYY